LPHAWRFLESAGIAFKQWLRQGSIQKTGPPFAKTNNPSHSSFDFRREILRHGLGQQLIKGSTPPQFLNKVRRIVQAKKGVEITLWSRRGCLQKTWGIQYNSMLFPEETMPYQVRS